MEEFFLSLIKLGVGNASVAQVPEQIDWNALEELAVQQGLSAVMVDGIEMLPEVKRPPQPVLLQWIGETLQGFEYRYELYRRAIAEIAGFYNSHGYKMMLLKGYACGLDWPKPEHRPFGDIDIWLFGQQKEADYVLAKERGLKIDKSHHHHTVFDWCGFMVENHYFFINVHQHKSHVALEKILKKEAMDDSCFIELYGEKVYLPTPNFHALFLLRHSMLHFAFGEFSLRNLLDWAFFVKAHIHEIDWNWLETNIEKFGMTPLYRLFNAICIDDLGFDAGLFSSGEYDSALKERVLREALHGNHNWEEPINIIRRQIFRYKRWKANGWKHKLCYKESMWSAFWSGVWSHLVKPNTI